MEELAVLPVFFKLKGKKVVLAGGSDAAAWKAELLAASGAIVHVYAATLDPTFDEVIASQENAFVHHARLWSNDIFENAAIAIADAETQGEAQAFYCAARAAGVPVNVIDKPDFCEFQFGSIVNRSPAIVSISTDGAAPILGQAIRRRIETLLPLSVKSWAQLAQKIRSQVTSALEMGQERRVFWERFVDKAFSANPTAQDEAALLKDITKISTNGLSKSGKVTLVGAGPGDAELLTLKAVRALQAADVILFDDLASDDVLELARREAKRMLVGKRGGRDSCKQEDINDMMVKLAISGKNVVRLKSGDPMVFGRAGEEIKRLGKEGIEVSIVPGITAASAMASHLGISLTHRDHAQSVRFVTGHSKKGELPTDINWQAVADETATTIFYMGGRTASRITDTLVANGMDENTPVVICSSVSRKESQTWHGTLAKLPKGIEIIGYSNPVLIGVGNVFGEALEQGNSNTSKLAN
ncbi:MAG: siroheme synthase CysG [Nitratireductor sp.]